MYAVEIEQKIKELAQKFAKRLQQKVESRIMEMEHDDQSHFLIYRVLGVSIDEGKTIDIYQNKGRFLYRYAGSFLEVATKLCFEEKFPQSRAMKIANTISNRPKTFEIDCLVENLAYEIKWRDATTDGDHITKEHARLKATIEAGYEPRRLMFYYPNRTARSTHSECFGRLV